MALRIGVAAALVISVTGLAMGIDIEMVPVGSPGNAGEWSGESYGGYGSDRICGAVDYAYMIGKFEVTADQYCEFLNAVAGTDTYELYNSFMWTAYYGCKIQQSGSSGSYTYSVPDPCYPNRPVNYVSWGDAARFCNWLTNGQPSGAQDLATTEDGSYYLDGATLREDLLDVERKPDANYVIPTEDEWYKAAYHKNDGATGNYFDYPTSSDSVPSNDLVNPDPGNNANFRILPNDYTIGAPYWRTVVREFENSHSPYRTFDQGGNVWEWNEANQVEHLGRGLRGGSFDPGGQGAAGLHAANRNRDHPERELYFTGFRVASRTSFTLTIYVNKPLWGYVDRSDPNDLFPNVPGYQYRRGTELVLTAVPYEGNCFRKWKVWDPNHPGDANYVVIDTNNPITIVMDADRKVKAIFKCGCGGIAPLLGVTLGMLGLGVLLRRRT